MGHVNKKTGLTIIFLLCLNIVFAQNKKKVDSVSRIVHQIMWDHFPSEKLKDSTALYAGDILIEVKRTNEKQEVALTLSDPKLLSVFTGSEALKKVDFSSLMGNDIQKVFIFKYCLVVHDSTYKSQMVNLSEVSDSILKLVRKPEPNIIDLGFIMIVYDKKVYE